MDIHLPLSATIKVVKMEHKKKKITMGFALLVCAMVALVGVGYALAYQGSANTNIDDATGELVTVAIAKTGFTEGEIYTVDTSNNRDECHCFQPDEEDDWRDCNAVHCGTLYLF